MTKFNIALGIACLVIIGLAICILPRNALVLLTQYQNSEHSNLSNSVRSLDDVTCDLVLTTQGPFSALNPITATIQVITDSQLQNELNFSYVSVFLFGARAFPQNVSNSEYGLVNILLHSTKAINGWNGSVQVVYMASGNFDLSVNLLDWKMQAIVEVPFFDAITVGSQDLTFTYVTGITLLSLELVIIAVMLLDLRTKNGHDAQHEYSETKVWKVSRKGIYCIRKVRKKPRQDNDLKRKE